MCLSTTQSKHNKSIIYTNLILIQNQLKLNSFLNSTFTPSHTHSPYPSQSKPRISNRVFCQLRKLRSNKTAQSPHPLPQMMSNSRVSSVCCSRTSLQATREDCQYKTSQFYSENLHSVVEVQSKNIKQKHIALHGPLKNQSGNSGNLGMQAILSINYIILMA